MKNFLLFLLSRFATIIAVLSFPYVSFGQAPDLGTAGNFVLFTPVGAVGSTGISHIAGNVGSDDGAITGFEGLNVMLFNADAVTEQCTADVLAAYTQLNNTPATLFPSPVLGNGQILYSGVYSIPQAASLNGSLTLDGQGDPNAIFIIKVQGAFTTSASSTIHLINGATTWNIYWKVEGAVSMAAGTTMMGIIIANNGAISMGIGTRFEGRALSTTGAISVYGVWAYGPGTIPLAVTLIDFKATKDKHAIELLWTVANEISFESYELERSSDGRNFYTIASIPATNTQIVKTYNWLDNSPLVVVNFYRLKMVNTDRSYKYSAIAKVYMGVRESISVYPNPVTGQTLQLEMYNQPRGNYTINLYSIDGKKVMSNTIMKVENDGVRSIALENNLLPGVYYLEISDPEKKKKMLNILIKRSNGL